MDKVVEDHTNNKDQTVETSHQDKTWEEPQVCQTCNNHQWPLLWEVCQVSHKV